MRTALAFALVLSSACSKTDGSKAKQAPPSNTMAAAAAAKPAPSAPAMAAEVPTVELPPPGTAPAPAAFSADNPMWSAPIKTLRGKPMTLAELKGKALLLVNVASQCGNTPQYAALEALQKKYEAKGFSVVGFPCNQFGGQEPGTAEEIEKFCSVNYGITFPITEKIEVNGLNRHPIYTSLEQIADASGHSGDIRWNFEKFVVSADGTKITRFSPKTKPDDPAVVAAVEAALPQ
jgi:glutathione peroxidase